jgi:hypothetical protein
LSARFFPKRSERGLCPRKFPGEASEGAVEAPSDDLRTRDELVGKVGIERLTGLDPAVLNQDILRLLDVSRGDPTEGLALAGLSVLFPQPL